MIRRGWWFWERAVEKKIVAHKNLSLRLCKKKKMQAGDLFVCCFRLACKMPDAVAMSARLRQASARRGNRSKRLEADDAQQKEKKHLIFLSAPSLLLAGKTRLRPSCHVMPGICCCCKVSSFLFSPHVHLSLISLLTRGGGANSSFFTFVFFQAGFYCHRWDEREKHCPIYQRTIHWTCLEASRPSKKRSRKKSTLVGWSRWGKLNRKRFRYL